jgi:D-glycero-D-manno-heptose 1,7-bisphosphate phosphatase
MAQKALFLDRDGVINKEVNYLYKKEDFEFIDGIFDLCRFYQDLGFKIIVVTNQSGIARGFYSEEDFEILTSWMTQEFLKKGLHLSRVYHCPHHPEISGPCRCRKPDIGMFLDAKKEFDIDLENSVMVGDHERDIEAAHKAGISQTYFFDEYNKTTDSKALKIVHRLEEIYR